MSSLRALRPLAESLINAIGNLAGFAGPVAMGYIKGATGSFSLVLIFIGLLAVMSFVLIFGLRFNRSHQQEPSGTVSGPS